MNVNVYLREISGQPEGENMVVTCPLYIINSIARIFYLYERHTVMNYDEDNGNGRSDN